MSNNSKPFICNIFPADSSGCNFWRNHCPMYTIEGITKDILFNINRRFIADPGYFNGVNINIFQRQVSNDQSHYFNNFIVPVSKAKGGWIIYNIDDCIHKDDIPAYNTAFEAYQAPGLMENIKLMMNNSDFVLVTTDELKQYYNEKFDVPIENIIVIPNYLPRWWMGGFYDKEVSTKLYRKYHKRPRIGIISSSSHFDMNNKKIDDDSTEIAKYIRKTCGQYRWVIFGTIIPSLTDLMMKGDVEYYQGCDILHYPQALKSLQLQAIVAPLLDNTFNRCKSNIKLLEGWAMGIPVIAQNLPTYSKYTDRVFSNNEELEKMIAACIGNEYRYETEIEKNYKKVQDWWLEGNIDKWLSLYKLRPKPIVIDLDKMIEHQNARKNKEIIIEK